MKTKIFYIGRAILTCLSAGIVFNTAPTVFAQSQVISEENAQSAIQFSETIRDQKLLTQNTLSLNQLNLGNLTPQDRLRHLRQYAHGTITLSNNFKAKNVLKAYQLAIDEAGTERDKKVFNLHKSFLERVDLSNPKDDRNILKNELEVALQNGDWFVASNAWLLKSILNAYTNDPNLALQETHEAYRLIPNEISSYVTDARILTLEMTTYLNNLLLNPDLAIENTREIIAQKQTAGYPIDGSSLLNNLLYSLSMWREYEVSTQIAQIVLELEKDVGSNTPGLTELRVAQLYDQQGDFETALRHARNGLEVVEIPSLKNGLLSVEINSLAGLGKISEATENLETLKTLHSVENQTKIFQISLIKAELGLAVNKSDKGEIYKLSNKLLDLNTQNLLRSYSTNTSKLIASLENTKERQAEREAGLKREAEQQKRTNQLLMILAAFLALATLLAVIFARYRDQVSKELALKTLEAEDADRMKSEFLGMVSHELRTPLNGIVGIADLLAMQAPTEDLRHKAGIILDSSNKLTHVIESIVDMSRIDGDKMELYPEPTDIHAIVTDLDQLWRPTIENKGVTFTCFVENTLTDEIVLDKARFRQCLNNLLSNAAKFTDNGRVHLHVTSQSVGETGEIEITAIIADTGQGMSDTVQGKLFTPFLQADSSMTRKHGGSGLGLAITQSLARMMDGDVTMVSNEGRGSEFTLTVRGQKSEASLIMDDMDALFEMATATPIKALESPVVLPPTQTVDISIESTPKAPQVDVLNNRPDTDNLRGLKVLIVEDIPANQDVLKLFLGPEGCESQCAANGIEALDILNTQAIDIILMDIRMPQMDGIEATQAIRKSGREYKNTPIIALTADASAETNAACMAAGADIFLTKPVMARELIESIRFVRRFQDYEADEASNAA